jgi:hypothetical protein
MFNRLPLAGHFKLTATLIVSIPLGIGVGPETAPGKRVDPLDLTSLYISYTEYAIQN